MKNKNTLSYITAIILAIIFIYPLYILILIAFEPISLTFGRLYPYQLPFAFTLAHFESSLKDLSLIKPVLRSVAVAFIVAALAIVLSISAGYGLNKLASKISNKVIVLMFFANMLPAIVIAIPISVYFIKLGLYDNILGIALAQELVVLPISTFIMLGGFRALPADLENQANIDGAGMISTFRYVIAPLIKIPLIITFLLAWMTSWDEFTYAIIISPLAPTFPVSLYNYVSRGEPFISASFALLVTVPVILIVVFLQKYLKGEYLTGGMKS